MRPRRSLAGGSTCRGGLSSPRRCPTNYQTTHPPTDHRMECGSGTRRVPHPVSPSSTDTDHNTEHTAQTAQCWRDRIAFRFSKPFRICTATLARSGACTDCICVPINSLAPPPPRRPSWWSLPRLVFRHSEDFQTLVAYRCRVSALRSSYYIIIPSPTCRPFSYYSGGA